MNDTVLQVQGLCKNYPAFTLSEVSFSLEAGRIMGFIGRNGAGKTTTLKSIPSWGWSTPMPGRSATLGCPLPKMNSGSRSRSATRRGAPATISAAGSGRSPA